MAHTFTVVNQKFITGFGYITVGRFIPTGTYATNGEDATTSLQAKLPNAKIVDFVSFGYDRLNSAMWDSVAEKVRVYKLTAGVLTELANAAAYDASVSIPYVCYSR